MNRKQKILLFFSLAVIIVIAVFYLTEFRRYKKEITPVSTNVSFSEKKIDPNTIPGNLPQNLPGNNGAITENKIVTSQFLDATLKSQTETQSVRRYYSDKTIKQNATEFEKYFSDNGWVVKHKQEEVNMMVYFAENPNKSGVLKILITKNSGTGDVMVEVSLVE